MNSCKTTQITLKDRLGEKIILNCKLTDLTSLVVRFRPIAPHPVAMKPTTCVGVVAMRKSTVNSSSHEKETRVMKITEGRDLGKALKQKLKSAKVSSSEKEMLSS